MSIGHVKLGELIKAARHDNLEALKLLPDGVDLSRVGRLPFVVAQSPTSAHRVLVEDAESYRKPLIVRQVIVDGLGENLFTLDGERWLARRKPIAPVFGLNNLDALASLIRATVDDVLATWTSGEIDIQEAMTDIALEVAVRGLLGVDEHSAALASDVRRAFEEILEWVSHRFNEPLSPPPMVPTSRNRRMKRAKAELQRAVRALISHRRSRSTESFDILGQLLHAQTESGGELTDEAIIDECIGFLFAGHETTASTLTWALYELSLRPELQDAVAAEGRQLDGTAEPVSPIVEVLKAMPVTDSVMHETLRMYPAGITIGRSAKRSTQLAGTTIRRFTLVMIPVYAIQRSAELWENPDDFDPTRKHNEAEGYLPFGLGPRRCLGARFARTEMTIAIARICSHWTLSYQQDQPPRPITAPSLRAEGTLNLNLDRRS